MGNSFLSRLTGSLKQTEPEYEFTESPFVSNEPREAELSIDMFDRGDEIIIQTIIAGVRIEDIDLSVSRLHISVRGFRENPFEESYDKQGYVNQEIFWGPFSREIDLPDEVDIDKIEALEDHGMLTIRLPKTDKNRMSRVRIKN